MTYRNDLIKGKMAQLGISVEKLAEMTGLAPNTISKVRQGLDARLSTLSTIADALDMPLAELFADREAA